MSEDLTDEQIAELKADLLQLRQDLNNLLQATRQGTRPVDLDEPIGRLTRMDAMQQQSMAKANRYSHDLRLRQVQQSLRLVEQGEYGLCRRCEEPIAYRRLKARPESPYCIACQDEVDRSHG